MKFNQCPNIKLKSRKKRTEYHWISSSQRLDLLFRTVFLKETVSSVCKSLNINYFTGRNLIQNYRKFGIYEVPEKSPFFKTSITAIKGTTCDTKKPQSNCNLTILITSDENLKIATTKVKNPEEEAELQKIHNQMMKSNVV